MAKQITVRGVSPELSRRLARLSRERKESLNTVVLRLLENAVGAKPRRSRLERYATWTSEDLEEFDRALRWQRKIDDALWR